MHLRLAVVAAACLAAAGAAAQGRPSEEDLFGAPPAAAAPQAPRPADQPAKGAEAARPPEGELFGGQGSPNATPPPPEGVVSREKEDALKVGGQLYLRAITGGLEEQDVRQWRLASPNLLDTYLDVRPNDRVRGFALGRLFYDPTILPPDAALNVVSLSSLVQPGFGGTSASNPRAVLDQLWLNFDVERRAFVTVGRQHAKWGVGRFWNPTDYLHPVKRNPLAVFDERTGTTMVKVHVPWEARGWNFYAVSVVEDVAGDPPRRADGTQDGTGRLGRLGAGGRAEVVLAGVEVGADALVQSGHRPRFGLDFSTGLWDLDVYAEAALRSSVDTPRWREAPGGSADLLTRYERHDPLGFTPQIVVGATYSAKYSDEDAVTFGGEYFYDHSGYDNPRIYPALLAVSGLSSLPAFTFEANGATTTVGNPYAGQPTAFTPFYLGKHYAGVFVSLPNPGRWNNTTFTLSVLGNLSDKSFVARLDHAVLALTYLRVETYVGARFGAREGEFRAGFAVPAGTIGGAPFRGFSTAPAIVDAGVALRVSL
jgi:hypothetical protein